jgi:hypothetical protein
MGNTYWLLLRGGFVQSIPCNCDHFLIYCAPHLSSNHSQFIHQSSLLWLQQTPSRVAERDWVKNSCWILPTSQYLYHTLRDLLTWSWWLHFPSKRSHAMDFYHP